MAAGYVIRIMLALLTAVWSPSWCCCSQRAAASHEGTTASCHSSASTAAEMPSHCHTTNNKPPPAPQSHTPARHATCACSSTPADKPAAPAVTASNAAFEVALADAAPCIFVAPLPIAPVPLLEPSLPLTASLLRLHCALIV